MVFGTLVTHEKQLTFLATKLLTTVHCSVKKSDIFYMLTSKMVIFYSAGRQQSGRWSFIRPTFYVQDKPLGKGSKTPDTENIRDGGTPFL